LEIVAVAVTLTAVYLTTRQIVWCWPLGMVSVSLYAVVFFQAKLYADMGLQGLYFVLAVYGWWSWLRGGTDHGRLQVSRLSPRPAIVLLFLTAAVGWVGGLALGRLTDASLPRLDSLLTSFSIAAQWMQTRKILESWLVWIAVDVLYVGMFAYKELFLTSALYAVFLALAGLGFADWRRSLVGEVT